MIMWTIPAALVCLLIAVVIALTIMLIKRSKLKSVRMERTACNYERAGSFKVTNQRDSFLYSNITRIPRPQNTGGGARRR